MEETAGKEAFGCPDSEEVEEVFINDTHRDRILTSRWFVDNGCPAPTGSVSERLMDGGAIEVYVHAANNSFMGRFLWPGTAYAEVMV